jgi:transcriptional regulator with XRE-family HTH domain
MNKYELRRYLQNYDYTQKDLAKRMNLSEGTISDWVIGRTIIQKRHYARLEYIFEIKINENVCTTS